jgi:hypothetical protein
LRWMRFLVVPGRLAVLDLAGRYIHDELSALAEIAGTLRALSCHVFAPFALIFSARVHAQVGESQLELLVLHCDARP